VLLSVLCNADVLGQAGPETSWGSDAVVLIEVRGFYFRIMVVFDNFLSHSADGDA